MQVHKLLTDTKHEKGKNLSCMSLLEMTVEKLPPPKIAFGNQVWKVLRGVHVFCASHFLLHVLLVRENDRTVRAVQTRLSII